jgi:hypothetical protein
MMAPTVRAGQITLTEWVNGWYPALDLELTTLRNYRYLIDVLIRPAFGDRSLASLTAEEISARNAKPRTPKADSDR